MSVTRLQVEKASRMTADERPPGAADFDFLIGRRWVIRNRRLVDPFGGGDGWEEFDGTLEGWFLLGGLGNVDSFYSDADPAWGSTLRLFDPELRIWTIYWADSLDPTLREQARGRFRDGLGEFFGSRALEGQQVDLRFLWLDITADSARWEQAFRLPDRPWETMWVREFHASH